MRRGCISLGEIRCDACKRLVPTAERYFITDEEVDENGKKKTVRYCMKCCQEKGLVGYRQEKDERVLTFSPPDEKPAMAKPLEKTEETDKKEQIIP